MAPGIIYGLIDPVSFCLRYVGKTLRSIRKREVQHLWRSKRENNHVANWIKSLIRKNAKPIWVIIDYCNEDELNECEKFWIAYFKCLGADLTNGTLGGDGGAPTPSTRAKISVAHKGKKHTIEHRAAISAGLMGKTKGRTMSVEARRKMSAAAKNMSVETRNKMSAAHKGVPLSATHKLHLAESHKGRVVSAETRAKIKASNTGKRRSEETKRRLSEAHRGRSLSESHRRKISIAISQSRNARKMWAAYDE